MPKKKTKAQQEAADNLYKAMKRIGTAKLSLASLRRMVWAGEVPGVTMGDIDRVRAKLLRIERQILSA